MATLRNHKGIKTLYRWVNGTRYAVCNDGKILAHIAGGWKLANPRVTAELLAAKVAQDTTPQGQAIITRANRDAHAHESTKRIRRARRLV